MNNEELQLYSWVIRGSQRTKIIRVMKKPLTPTQIKKLTKLSLNNISDTLRHFTKKKIAKCLNEKEKLGRIYILTLKGKRIESLVNQ